MTLELTTPTSFEAGYATFDFTPPPGLPLLGQMHERIATGARDPLEACAVALRSNGQTVVLVAADVCALGGLWLDALQAEWHRQTGLPPGNLLVHSTHTHDAPATGVLPLTRVDDDFVASLGRAVLQSATDALGKLEPVEVFSACGFLEEMGWNRRAMFEDGTSRMYGSSADSGFTGMEGPRDGALPVLWTRNASGDVTGVLVNFATHPNSIESALVYSADVPGTVRASVKALLGQNIGVVYLTGAAGNTAPSILDPLTEPQPWRGDAGVERSGLYVAGEVAKIVAATLAPIASPDLQLESNALQIPVRDWPQPGAPDAPPQGNFGGEYYENAHAHWGEQQSEHNPVETRVNVLRIGDTVICTNPAELFVEFGLQIREHSRARVTFISELTDGYVGYVPSSLAFTRGGYETWCAPSSQLVHSAGDQIVSATCELLDKAFGKG